MLGHGVTLQSPWVVTGRDCWVFWGCARIAGMDDLKYWVALSGIPHLGTARFRLLEAYFGLLEDAWAADATQLREAGLDSRTAQEVVSGRRDADPDEGMEALARAGVKAANWNSEEYPPRLREIHDPPPVLYYLGELKPSDQFSVAVVGTRNPTSYGREAAAVLSRDLASSGITIVSGLALGIDGVAHRAALDCGGRTIAVVAGGLDSVYPREHAGLFRQIQTRGGVVSEHKPGVRPDARNFPRRNRLISGMTLGTLVVEAGEGSGTRWTVQQALEQDREVFCVPGSIFSPASSFTNRMIKEGAKLVGDYTDVLEELNLPEMPTGSDNPERLQKSMDFTATETFIEEDDLQGLDADESSLVARLSGEPVHVDDLCRQSGIPIATITSMLTLLELKGKVAQVGSMHYIRASASEVVHGS